MGLAAASIPQNKTENSKAMNCNGAGRRFFHYAGHQNDAQKYSEEYEKKAAQANDMMSSAVNAQSIKQRWR